MIAARREDMLGSASVFRSSSNGLRSAMGHHLCCAALALMQQRSALENVGVPRARVQRIKPHSAHAMERLAVVVASFAVYARTRAFEVAAHVAVDRLHEDTSAKVYEP